MDRNISDLQSRAQVDANSEINETDRSNGTDEVETAATRDRRRALDMQQEEIRVKMQAIEAEKKTVEVEKMRAEVKRMAVETEFRIDELQRTKSYTRSTGQEYSQDGKFQ